MKERYFSSVDVHFIPIFSVIALFPRPHLGFRSCSFVTQERFPLRLQAFNGGNHVEGPEAFNSEVHLANIVLKYSSVHPNISVGIYKMTQRAAWLLCCGLLRVVYIIFIKPALKSSCGGI
jgi:hypothetical protein